MKTKLLLDINDLEQAQYFIEKGYGSLFLSVIGLSSTKEFNCYTNEISFLNELALKKGVELIINLDMLYHEDDLLGLRAVLKKLNSMGIKTLVISDVGVVALAKELGLEFKYINGSSILNTNYASLNSMNEYYDAFFLSNEININEIKKIIGELKTKAVIQVFGKQRIFSSKRLLLSAYYEYLEKPIADFHPRQRFLVSDINEKDNFSYIYEDDNGTFVYTRENVSGLEYLNELDEDKVQYYYLSNLFCKKDDYQNVIEIFYQYLNKEISLNDAKQRLDSINFELSNSFFEDQTIYTLDQIKSLEMERSNE